MTDALEWLRSGGLEELDAVLHSPERAPNYAHEEAAKQRVLQLAEHSERALSLLEQVARNLHFVRSGQGTGIVQFGDPDLARALRDAHTDTEGER